jgi:hypothetical protein
VKKRYRKLLSACAAGIAGVFALFLTASAPHRVHHLLENLPAPKTESGNTREPALSSASNGQVGIDGSSESKSEPSGHDHRAHDHSSHAHHHGTNVKHHHDHSHKHSQPTHRHIPSTAPSETAAEPVQRKPEPLHANTPKRDAHHDNSTQTDCIVQAAAQRAQFAPVEIAQIAFLDSEFDLRFTVQSVAFTAFDPSPFSQRAPPRV